MKECLSFASTIRSLLHYRTVFCRILQQQHISTMQDSWVLLHCTTARLRWLQQQRWCCLLSAARTGEVRGAGLGGTGSVVGVAGLLLSRCWLQSLQDCCQCEREGLSAAITEGNGDITTTINLSTKHQNGILCKVLILDRITMMCTNSW